MKAVIIPDLHNKVHWVEKALSAIPHDRVVFLGDYFDGFHDTPAIAANTARWLKQSLQHENRIHLYGNHDCPYSRWNNRFVACPGYTDDKQKAINKILDRQDWDKLKFLHKEQGWWISHAGIHPDIFSHPMHGVTDEEIERIHEQGTLAFNSNLEHPLFQWSAARGMTNISFQVGGVTWLDWNNEFIPINDINQIVGHTICTKWIWANPVEHDEQAHPNYISRMQVVSSEPLRKQILIRNTDNWNLDCNCRVIGILENKKFSWIPNDFLP
jgi:hypothetical protein